MRVFDEHGNFIGYVSRGGGDGDGGGGGCGCCGCLVAIIVLWLVFSLLNSCSYFFSPVYPPYYYWGL